MIKEIVSRITMVKSDKAGFYDNIAKCKVYIWKDYYFDEYLATSKWSKRIKLN